MAQIELSSSQVAALEALSRDTGRSREQLLNEAVERLLDEARADSVDWRALLRAGEGLWEHRDDLPDFDELRKEWDRDRSTSPRRMSSHRI